MSDRITIMGTKSAFEREPLCQPFGFKGRYLTELWQVVAKLTTPEGICGLGLATQSVLYGDEALFSDHTELEGNALMYALTIKALDFAKNKSFLTPLELLDQLYPAVFEIGKHFTGRADLNPNFVFNALVSVDHAAWLLYRQQNEFTEYDAMIPQPYKEALSHRQQRIAIMYQVPYGMPPEQLTAAVEEGYFVFKIKTGYPGSQKTMLEKDKERLSAIHSILGAQRTRQTPNHKLYYTMDANGRYEKKELLMQYLEHAKQIGAFEHILLYEEPLCEENEEDVSDLGVRIAGDESIHDPLSAEKRIAQGYTAIVLKGIAKTLSLTLKIAKIACERKIPCLCADLTVNPILADWHKNLAARLAPFPEIGMGLMESNGSNNYKHWDRMIGYHPAGKASWSMPEEGMFHLKEDFYKNDGGVWEASSHYDKLVA